MRSGFKLEKTDNVEATLSVTMTLREWKQLLGQLPDEYPAKYQSYAFAAEIRKMITEAERQYAAEHKPLE